MRYLQGYRLRKKEVKMPSSRRAALTFVIMLAAGLAGEKSAASPTADVTKRTRQAGVGVTPLRIRISPRVAGDRAEVGVRVPDGPPATLVGLMYEQTAHRPTRSLGCADL
jgi:hypothetical protein